MQKQMRARNRVTTPATAAATLWVVLSAIQQAATPRIRPARAKTRLIEKCGGHGFSDSRIS
jgi:hypothetical protein